MAHTDPDRKARLDEECRARRQQQHDAWTKQAPQVYEQDKLRKRQQTADAKRKQRLYKYATNFLEVR